ncbi:MAG: lysophospholipid acyltransferase family protein [Calditrichota bacterium]
MQQESVGAGRHYPPEQPDFWFKAKTYLLVGGLVTPFISIFMNLLNRTRISGKRYIETLKPPFIMASNHISLLDDLFIGPILFFPYSLRGYRFIPYHAPEERNFYKVGIISWFMRQTKCIPLVRGQGLRQKGMDRLICAVRDGGILHIYPEGTRTRNGEIGEAKPGIGRLVQETGAPVIPVYHQGLENVLPIGSGVPRIGNEIRISIGEPMFFNEMAQQKSDLLIWKTISELIVDAIKIQRDAAHKRWGDKPLVVKNR